MEKRQITFDRYLDESKKIKFWSDFKKKHPDAILLFHEQDFYICYGEDDAVAVSEICGITLHKKGTEPMRLGAYFPEYALDAYLPKLVRAGKRVAICDEIEAPKSPKTKPIITEYLTPSKSFVDQDGVLRHAIGRESIERLYKDLENFIADCTKQEVENHKNALNEIKTFIHQRLQESV